MSLLSLDEARAQLLAGARPLTETETVATSAALGRVLAHHQTAALQVPALDNSAMDGYALRCADVPTAGTRLPISQRIPAGSVGQPLVPGTAARIFTGAPIPAGADAVVMQEQCTLINDQPDCVVVQQPPQLGAWIRRAGEDVRAGATVLTAGTRLLPQHLGLAAALGMAQLPVLRRLRVALLSTGNELIMPGELAPEALPSGAIFNSNRFLLASLLQQLGCVVTDLGNIPDQLDATRAALRVAAASHDLILSSGGVSVGEEDHVKPAVQAEGRLDLWKIAIKPGKPLAFGQVRSSAKDTTAFIGLPGNPVASFVTFLILVRPFILKAQGLIDVPLAQTQALRLRAAFDWPRADARREFLRARRNVQGEVELYPQQGSAVLTSCTWADGLVDNPPAQTIQRGDVVSFLPFSDLLY